MMYPYMTLGEDIEITHSHIVDENGVKMVQVHFERPIEDGFDTARCTLPEYKWIKEEGFSDEEINKFEIFLQRNAHLIYKYAG